MSLTSTCSAEGRITPCRSESRTTTSPPSSCEAPAGQAFPADLNAWHTKRIQPAMWHSQTSTRLRAAATTCPRVLVGGLLEDAIQNLQQLSFPFLLVHVFSESAAADQITRTCQWLIVLPEAVWEAAQVLQPLLQQRAVMA